MTVQYGDPIRFEQVEEPTREQSQAAADVVFAEIKKLHGALREADGRKQAIAAARSARRAAGEAAEAATRSAGSSALKLSQSCPGMISAPGRPLAVALDLLQRAAEVVLVGHLVRQHALLERPLV